MRELTSEHPLEHSPSPATEDGRGNPRDWETAVGKQGEILPKQRDRAGVVLYQLLQAQELPQPLGQLAQLVVLQQEAPQAGQLQQLLGKAPQLVVAGVEIWNTKGKEKHSGVFRDVRAHRIFVSHSLLVRTLPPLRKTWERLIIFIYLFKTTFNPTLNLQHPRVFLFGGITSPCAQIYKITPVNRRF